MPKPRDHHQTWEPSPFAHTAPLPLACETDLVNPFLRVGDVMTTDFRACAPGDGILAAAETFAISHCGFLPVIESARPVGVVTDRDVALAIHEYRERLFEVKIGDIMTSPVVTIGASAKLDAVIAKMEKHGVRRLVVTDGGGRTRGIVSVTDLVPFIPNRGVGKAVSGVVKGRARVSKRYRRILEAAGQPLPPTVRPTVREVENERRAGGAVACTR